MPIYTIASPPAWRGTKGAFRTSRGWEISAGGNGNVQADSEIICCMNNLDTLGDALTTEGYEYENAVNIVLEDGYYVLQSRIDCIDTEADETLLLETGNAENGFIGTD